MNWMRITGTEINFVDKILSFRFNNGSWLTTSGSCISCRKEWRWRVVRGLDILVNGQRSEARVFVDSSWARQCRNHTWDLSGDSVLKQSQTEKIQFLFQQLQFISAFFGKKRTYPRYFKTGPADIRTNLYMDPYAYAVSINDLCSLGRTISFSKHHSSKRTNCCICTTLHFHNILMFLTYLGFPDYGRTPPQCLSSLWLPSPSSWAHRPFGHIWSHHAEWLCRRMDAKINQRANQKSKWKHAHFNSH